MGHLSGRLRIFVTGLCVASALGTTAASASASPAAPTKPSIDRVVLRGDPTDPQVLIYGHGFGTRPAPNPPNGTSNFGRCGPIPGDTGYDFGSDLWIGDRTQNWSAGYTPNTDCIGLILVKYSDQEIDFRPGALYTLAYGQPHRAGGTYKLAEGDIANIDVKGVEVVVTVHYLRGSTRSACPPRHKPNHCPPKRKSKPKHKPCPPRHH